MTATGGSVGPVPYAGHIVASVQAPHAGLRAWQTRRPWKMIRCESIVHSRRSMSLPTAVSIFTGSVSVVHAQRPTSRWKWVSTVSPGTSNALPRITLAVLRPMPGSVTRSTSRPGTCPSNRSTSA